jgi:CheY-like chemotaxis protein
MSGLHVLIIDDDASSLKVMGQMLSLQEVGFTKIQDPTTFSSVVAKLSRIDVVFLDLEMPTLNGYDIFHTIRSDARFGKVPIVAYSAYDNQAATAQELGFHSFLKKPLDIDEFPNQLQRILHGEPVWSL